jgi:hypothetical protein
MELISVPGVWKSCVRCQTNFISNVSKARYKLKSFYLQDDMCGKILRQFVSDLLWHKVISERHVSDIIETILNIRLHITSIVWRLYIL